MKRQKWQGQKKVKVNQYMLNPEKKKAFPYFVVFIERKRLRFLPIRTVTWSKRKRSKEDTRPVY